MGKNGVIKSSGVYSYAEDQMGAYDELRQASTLALVSSCS